MRDPAEEGRRWLKQAEEDLRWARHLAREGAYHLACFLAQQVAEKPSKAFLYAQGREIVLGHSVERLCREAAHYDAHFDEHASRWAILDGYYVPTRYPNSLPGASRQKSTRAKRPMKLCGSLARSSRWCARA
jgi:HEPN domain-containing protein